MGPGPLVASGEYTDAETGFQYLRARYYDPGTGQFLTRDPIEAVTRSPYGYVGGNPLNRVDPSGLDWYDPRDWDQDVAGFIEGAGEAAWDNRGTIATIAAAGGCFVPGVGWGVCAGISAAAYAVRAQQRVERDGLSNSLRSNLVDGGLTYLTIGLGGAFDELAGAWPGVRGFGALPLDRTLGYLGRFIPGGYDAMSVYGWLKERGLC